MNAPIDAAAAELRDHIGQVTTTEIEPIPTWWAQRFAMACGETSAVFFDEAAAREEGWEAIPLPPLLLSSTRAWGAGVRTSELSPDGTVRHDVGLPRNGGFRALGGGQRLAFVGDALTGVGYTAEAEIVGVEQKSGRSGDLLIVEMQRRFSIRGGELVLVCDESRVLR
ncbi:MAG: MaoC family dehydratase N-terminal domain-containing protein [Acidimicrobiia bacterium]